MPTGQRGTPLTPTQTLPAGDGAGHLWHPSVNLYAIRDAALRERERLLLPFLSPPRAPTRTTGSVAQQMTVVAKNGPLGLDQASRSGPSSDSAGHPSVGGRNPETGTRGVKRCCCNISACSC